MKIVRKNRRIILVAAAILTVVAFYPYQSAVVPTWRLQLVDKEGAGIPNIGVRQVWRHYSLEWNDHEEDFITDADGYVTFPERTVRATILHRAVESGLDWLHSKTGIFIHSSSGPHTYIVVLSGGYSYEGYNNGEGSPPERVVLRPVSDVMSAK
jgi:hypothetical protein